MAKTFELKPEEQLAREYADRLILHKLTELHSAIKLSDIADKLQGDGLELGAIRALLASNPDKFAYSERRWIPAARMDGEGRPFAHSIFVVLDRFGGPMPIALLASEIAFSRGISEEEALDSVTRFAQIIPDYFLTNSNEVALRKWVFSSKDEKIERAYAMHKVTAEEVAEAASKLGKFDWTAKDAIPKALKSLAPIPAKLLGAVAWTEMNPQAPHSPQHYDWVQFNAALLSTEGYVYGADGMMSPASDVPKWISTANKVADKVTPVIEVEDAAPIEIKSADVDKMVKKIVAAGGTSITSTKLLEEFYEITPLVKTFPDDFANLMTALKERTELTWVGGDRFQKAGQIPEIVNEIPEVFQYKATEFRDEEGEYVDGELNDEGLSSTLRKLLFHPLATDVLDEEVQPAPKQQPDSLRMVLKPIHRELGTFPLCQIPTGWLDATPAIQELIFIDSTGRELQVWVNMETRLMFNLVDWFYEQPVESGAVFSIAKTNKANVFEFDWLDQTDPVVFITSQRMEELRNIADRADELSTLQITQEVMSHWPKGADFLTILWEVNVVRRSSRCLVASLLSSYACFYQRSGSPVWHFDSKKIEQGFDKTKRKFVLKR